MAQPGKFFGQVDDSVIGATSGVRIRFEGRATGLWPSRVWRNVPRCSEEAAVTDSAIQRLIR